VRLAALTASASASAAARSSRVRDALTTELHAHHRRDRKRDERGLRRSFITGPLSMRVTCSRATACSGSSEAPDRIRQRCVGLGREQRFALRERPEMSRARRLAGLLGAFRSRFLQLGVRIVDAASCSSATSSCRSTRVG